MLSLITFGLKFKLNCLIVLIKLKQNVKTASFELRVVSEDFISFEIY